MSDYVFLFDLDSTITKQEILPTIACSMGCGEQMRELTEDTMAGSTPFRESFLSRVDLLKGVSVSAVANMIGEIPVHQRLCEFIRENKDRCFIVTGNLDVWICRLMEKMGMADNLFCSKGIVSDDTLLGVASVIDKSLAAAQFVRPFVAVGDGSNDAEMVARAAVGIGFGAVRPIAPSLMNVASHAVYDEERLCQFLKRLL